MMFIDREILDGIEINYPTDEELEAMYREYLIEKEYSENG